MADWTADDVVAGREIDHDERARRYREAMTDPESVAMVIKGRNGHRLEHRIPAGEHTYLTVTQTYDQEQRPDYGYLTPLRTDMWLPSWRRYTWAIEARTGSRAEDFQVPLL